MSLALEILNLLVFNDDTAYRKQTLVVSESSCSFGVRKGVLLFWGQITLSLFLAVAGDDIAWVSIWGIPGA